MKQQIEKLEAQLKELKEVYENDNLKTESNNANVLLSAVSSRFYHELLT